MISAIYQDCFAKTNPHQNGQYYKSPKINSCFPVRIFILSEFENFIDSLAKQMPSFIKNGTQAVEKTNLAIIIF